MKIIVENENAFKVFRIEELRKGNPDFCKP